MSNSSDYSEPALSALKAISLLVLIVWTTVANGLVFVVLYQNPKLRTVPNLLVANLAFSDLMLGLIVLPFAAAYTVVGSWIFGRFVCEVWLSCDVLICTSSIWNLSMVGLDRYWAITSPVKYLNKRTVKSAAMMIASVWSVSAAISLPPLAGWKQMSKMGNYFETIPNSNMTDDEKTYECSHFQDLMAYTIYSATGSFYIPMLLMFYVYYRIYKAFLDHHLRQKYRHNVLRKHLESTILRDLSHVMPEDEPGKTTNMADVDDDDDDDESSDESSEEVCGKNAINEEVMEYNFIPNERTPLQSKDIVLNEGHYSVQTHSNVNPSPQPSVVLYPPVPTLKPSVSSEEIRSSVVEDSVSSRRLSEQIVDVASNTLQPPKCITRPSTPVEDISEVQKARSELCLATDTEVGEKIEKDRRQSASPALTSVVVHRPDVARPEVHHHHHHHVHLSSQMNQSYRRASAEVVKSKPVNKSLFGGEPSTVIENPACTSPLPEKSPKKSKRSGSAGVRKELVFNTPHEVSETEQTSIIPSKKVAPIPRPAPVPPLKKAASSKSIDHHKKPKAISAAKEKRGVKVLGIILGCFTLCWLPFFIMYFVKAFCTSCYVNIHVEQFITWLGYANSAMNPIIYTVFNRDYQIALRRLLQKSNKLGPKF